MTDEPIVMSREWLAAVLEALDKAGRGIDYNQFGFGGRIEKRWVPTPSIRLPRCPHPACDELPTTINVQHPNRLLPTAPEPTVLFGQRIILTWEPCRHSFRVPVEETADATPR